MSIVQAQKYIRTKQVLVNGSKVAYNYRLAKGDVISTSILKYSNILDKPAKPKPASNIKLKTIYEDDKIIVINKPFGLASQGGNKVKQNVDDTYPNYHLVHRLDKDTTGCLMLAKTPKVAKHLMHGFQQKNIIKTYIALVVGVPKPIEGQINLPIIKQKQDGNEIMVIDEHNPKAQKAITNYKVLERLSNKAAIIELQPITGRKHQLRCHLAAIGNPIVGDGKYGGKYAHLGGFSNKLHLHALSLSLNGLLDLYETFTAPLPDHMHDIIDI